MTENKGEGDLEITVNVETQPPQLQALNPGNEGRCEWSL